MTETPGYWVYETSGVLRPAVKAYLARDEMTPQEIAAMRAYLRQWIEKGAWARDGVVEELKRDVDGLTSRLAIQAWLDKALDVGIDPL
jgi:hypothetical protein